MKIVVDSSVIVKWLNTTDEENVEEANTLLSDVLDNKIELLAPELAKYEIGNVLLKSKKLTVNEATIAFGTANALPITFIADSEELANDTYSLAYKNNITYYDASFLSLAKQYNATLITSNVKHQGKSSEIRVTPLKDY